MGGVWGGNGKGFLVGLKETVVNNQMTQERKEITMLQTSYILSLNFHNLSHMLASPALFGYNRMEHNPAALSFPMLVKTFNQACHINH